MKTLSIYSLVTLASPEAPMGEIRKMMEMIAPVLVCHGGNDGRAKLINPQTGDCWAEYDISYAGDTGVLLWTDLYALVSYYFFRENAVSVINALVKARQ